MLAEVRDQEEHEAWARKILHLEDISSYHKSCSLFSGKGADGGFGM